MNWEIIFYSRQNGEVPVEHYLLSVDKKMRAKISRSISLISEMGPNIGLPHTKYLREGVSELRIVQGNNISRVFYFHWYMNKLVLLNAFTKKTNKTPPSELERALQYKEDFFRQQEEGKYEKI